MDKQLRHIIFLSALLHDIGKIPQRAGKTNEFFKKYSEIIGSALKSNSNLCTGDDSVDSIVTFVTNHYAPKTETQALIMLADCWSGSIDCTGHNVFSSKETINNKQVTLGGGRKI